MAIVKFEQMTEPDAAALHEDWLAHGPSRLAWLATQVDVDYTVEAADAVLSWFRKWSRRPWSGRRQVTPAWWVDKAVDEWTDTYFNRYAAVGADALCHYRRAYLLAQVPLLRDWRQRAGGPTNINAGQNEPALNIKGRGGKDWLVHLGLIDRQIMQCRAAYRRQLSNPNSLSSSLQYDVDWARNELMLDGRDPISGDITGASTYGPAEPFSIEESPDPDYRFLLSFDDETAFDREADVAQIVDALRARKDVKTADHTDRELVYIATTMSKRTLNALVRSHLG